MTMIDNVERYITFKRHLGYKFDQAARTLRAFADESDACSDGLIRATAVIDWARKASTTGQARIRLQVVRDFAVWLHAEDRRHEVPSRVAFGPAPQRRPSPHLLTTVRVKEIMDAAVLLKSTGPLNRYTYHYNDRVACNHRAAAVRSTRLEADRHYSRWTGGQRFEARKVEIGSAS